MNPTENNEVLDQYSDVFSLRVLDPVPDPGFYLGEVIRRDAKDTGIYLTIIFTDMAASPTAPAADSYPATFSFYRTILERSCHRQLWL